jgi:uncharacterized membrane protein YidH (DUF202 family)
MIERYSDHAANERKLLAWVRTAIAIMAFRFLVQKFDLFLKIAAESLAPQSLPARGQSVGTVAGLLLIVMGGATWSWPRSASAGQRATSTPQSGGRAPGHGSTSRSWHCCCCSAPSSSSI